MENPIPTQPEASASQASAPIQNSTPSSSENPSGGMSMKKLGLPLLLIGALIVVAIGYGVFSSMKKTGSPADGTQPTEQSADQTESSLGTQEEMKAAPPQKEVANVEMVAPVANSVVSSPMAVTGIVPPGWMFEGQLTVRLLDDQNQVLVEAPGTESIPGSWQTGKSVVFTSSLSFTTTAPTGTLVIAKPNPSGLPENDESFSVPVKFQ